MSVRLLESHRGYMRGSETENVSDSPWNLTDMPSESSGATIESSDMRFSVRGHGVGGAFAPGVRLSTEDAKGFF